MAQRSTELVAAAIGILMAGGVYVPLDPEYPPARIEEMRRDAGLSRILTAEDLTAEDLRAPRAGEGPHPEKTGASRAIRRLHPLHVRLHRNPEGRDHLPRRARLVLPRLRRALRSLAAGPRFATRFDQLRYFDR